MSDRLSLVSRLSKTYPHLIPIRKKNMQWVEQIAWLQENVGERGTLWVMKLDYFWFIHQEDAVIFALRFSDDEDCQDKGYN